MPYIPPHKRKRDDDDLDDRFSEKQQRILYETLRRYLFTLVNKANASNLVSVLPELFKENIVRGRGLFCHALLIAQEASPSYTPVYASMIAVVNAKLPEIGELLVKRVVVGFKEAIKESK